MKIINLVSFREAVFNLLLLHYETELKLVFHILTYKNQQQIYFIVYYLE